MALRRVSTGLKFLSRQWLGAGMALAVWAVPLSAGEADVTTTPVASKEFKIDRFEWHGELELSQAVRRILVRNDYGDVRARFAGDGQVFVTAVLQRLGAGPDIGVNVERHGDALTVTVVSPPGRSAVSEERPGKTDVDRADLVIYVPEGAALEATSLRGIVEARGLKGRVDAETLDGEIRLDAAGPLRARSGSGSITAVLGSGGAAATVIETASGAIWLSLAKGSDYRLQLESGGKVTSPMQLKDVPGSVPVIVRSETGAVEIIERQP